MGAGSEIIHAARQYEIILGGPVLAAGGGMKTSERVAPEVTNNTAAGRFEIVADEQTAFLD